MQSFLVLDLETESKEHNKRKGCFCCCKIIVAGYKSYDTPSPYTDNCTEEELKRHLESYNILVAHNAKFECLHLWKYKTFQNWLLNGGKIWDTMVVEYYLSSFQHTYPALRDIAVNKYGCPERIKWIDKLLFDDPKSSYKCVSELPKDKVLEDVQNDVLDTEKVFLSQYQKVQRKGIMEVIEVQMEHVLATTELEYNGFKCDLEVLDKNEKLLRDRLDLKYSELSVIVNKYL